MVQLEMVKLLSMSGGPFFHADQHEGTNLLVATSRSNIKASRNTNLFACCCGVLNTEDQMSWHCYKEAEKLHEQNLKSRF